MKLARTIQSGKLSSCTSSSLTLSLTTRPDSSFLHSLLRLLCIITAATPPKAHTILVHELSTKVCRKEACGHCQRSTNGDIGRIRHKARGRPPHPPVISRTKNSDVVDQRVQNTCLGLFRTETIPCNHGLEFKGTGDDSRNGGEDCKDRGIVGERREERGWDGDVEGFERARNGAGSRRRHGCQVECVQGSGEKGEGQWEVDRGGVFGVPVVVSASSPKRNAAHLLSSHCSFSGALIVSTRLVFCRG